MTKGKRSNAAALARYYRQVRDNPLGGLLVEDLAASREHGQVTARVGIAPDGNPVLYVRDEATAKLLGAAVQRQTAVHVKVIPPLNVSEFRVLERQAMQAFGNSTLEGRSDDEPVRVLARARERDDAARTPRVLARASERGEGDDDGARPARGARGRAK